MTRLYWVAGVIAALAFAIAFINPSEPQPTPLPHVLDGEPDVYMEDAIITQFLPDGSIKYRLDAAEITHFEHDDLTRMVEPVFDLHDTEKSPWNISSRRGNIRRQMNSAGVVEEVVYLRDDVNLRQERGSGRYVNLATSAMYYYPDRQYAESDQAVIINTKTGRTRAVGFEGDLKDGWMKLFSSPEQRVHIIVQQSNFY